MLSTTSEMLHQIHSLIEKGYVKENRCHFDFSSIRKIIDDASEPISKNYVPFFRKDEFRKIEDRVVKLEQQNDKLIHIVHFLFERFAEVAKELLNFPEKMDDNSRLDNFNTMPEKEKRSFCEYSDKDRPVLTKREMEVFSLLQKGLCAKEIAKILFISDTTVITHKRNLKEKFNARNTVELISKVLINKAEY